MADQTSKSLSVSVSLDSLLTKPAFLNFKLSARKKDFGSKERSFGPKMRDDSIFFSFLCTVP